MRPGLAGPGRRDDGLDVWVRRVDKGASVRGGAICNAVLSAFFITNNIHNRHYIRSTHSIPVQPNHPPPPLSPNNHPTISLDAWVLHRRPTRAAECIPTVCTLHPDPFKPRVSWSHSTVATSLATANWRVRGRVGRPLAMTFVRAPTQVDVPVDVPTWPPNATVTGNGGCTSIPYLKSHLQKCVRKGNARLAVATTKQLLKLDAQQCVRRLAVIMVEDVAVHPTAFGVLLWWTAELAQRCKGREVTLRCTDVPLVLCEWLLGLVHVLCEHPTHTHFDAVVATPWQRLQDAHAHDRDDTHDDTTARRDLLLALYLRATYGGLKGDVVLMEQAAETTWRTGTDDWAPVRPVVWDSVVQLPAHAWDLDAIDFHVVPRLFELVARNRDHDRNDGRDEAEVEADPTFDWKRMMWENGSAPNVRDEACDEAYGAARWATWLPKCRPLQRWLVSKGYG